MGRTTEHAIIIGASLGGLCAARVLSDFYDRVTVYERDVLPNGPANRAAVPQGRHVHLLMARGAAEFDMHFPGLLDDMVADGVPMLENRPDCIHFGAAGHVLGTATRCATSSPRTCRAGRTSNGSSASARSPSPTWNSSSSPSPNHGSTRRTSASPACCSTQPTSR